LQAKEKIIGLEKYLHVDLGPALQKLRLAMSHLNHEIPKI